MDAMPPPLDDADARRLVHASARPPAGSLVLLEGAAARPAASWLAQQWAPPTDVARLAPPQGSWRAEDVTGQLFPAVRLVPSHRHAVVVDRAEELVTRLHDRVLKLFEEPPAPTWFLLCLPAGTDLPATISSRVALRLDARPAGDEQRARALVAAGADPATAARVVAAGIDDLDLEAAAAADPELLESFEHLFATHAAGSLPFARATATVDLLDGLAGSLGDRIGSTAAARRLLADLLIARWQAAGAAVLARPDLPDALAARVTGLLVATDRATRALDRNVAPAAVLADLMASA